MYYYKILPKDPSYFSEKLLTYESNEIINKYSEKINYQPNPIALSLKEKRSRSIGIIVCEIANSFFSQIINGIEYKRNWALSQLFKVD